ncbi:MAG: hypothetical protein Q8N88_05280 [Nanoarchaeota archaeon]|nr:hypothetical protein [Nanoarchaeota archaeon]
MFKKKGGLDKLEQEVKDSFDHVKQDFNKVGEWLKYFEGKHGEHLSGISVLKDDILVLKQDIEELKEFILMFKPQISTSVSKQLSIGSDKRALSIGVQTAVQTAVQTDILGNLTVMERGIVWALINSDMRLSYEDLAALLGKDKSTIRGQINAIRQKNNGLIEEFREITGKKRLFIPEEIRNKIIKSVKVKIGDSKKVEKRKSEGYNN